jgi:hypothetical protein
LPVEQSRHADGFPKVCFVLRTPAAQNGVDFFAD